MKRMKTYKRERKTRAKHSRRTESETSETSEVGAKEEGISRNPRRESPTIFVIVTICHRDCVNRERFCKDWEICSSKYLPNQYYRRIVQTKWLRMTTRSNATLNVERPMGSKISTDSTCTPHVPTS